MKNFAFFLLWFLFAPTLTGQEGGRHIYSFLNLSVSAKQAALGGENYTGLDGDVFQVVSNPAVVDSSMLYKPSLNYTNYLGDLNYGNLTYVFPVKKYGLFHASILYLNYGSFQYADEFGNRSGNFGASDSALLFGYAYSIPHTKFSMGINLKWIYSSLESYQSTGIATDIGFYYKNKPKGFEAAISFRNIGIQLTSYNGTKETLPFEIDAGFSQLLKHAPFKWHLTLENLQNLDIAFVNTAHNTQDPNGNIEEEEITIVDQIFRHIIIGAEIFPRKKFTFRLGYNFRRYAELSVKDQNFMSNIDMGFGVKLHRFQISYAYAKYHYSTNAHFFTATINLNEF